MHERDQHDNCGFTVDKIFKHISCWKTKDIYDICVGKKFREPTSKELSPSNFNIANGRLEKKIILQLEK